MNERDHVCESKLALGVDDPSGDTHAMRQAQKTAMMSPGEFLWSRTSLAPYEKGIYMGCRVGRPNGKNREIGFRSFHLIESNP
jgi:hypothetical protein